MNVDQLLLIGALICFIVSALPQVRLNSSFNLSAVGLALWVLTLLI